MTLLKQMVDVVVPVLVIIISWSSRNGFVYIVVSMLLESSRQFGWAETLGLRWAAWPNFIRSIVVVAVKGRVVESIVPVPYSSTVIVKKGYIW